MTLCISSEQKAFEYVFIQPYSKELAYIYEFLAQYLIERYPDKWILLMEWYRFYGESVLPGHHIFKFKWDLTEVEEDDRYVEVPFSDEYKQNPSSATAAMSERDFLALTKVSNNPVWQVFSISPKE